MRKATIIFLVTSLILSCRKEEKYQGTAMIIGDDARMGPCVGGIFIKIYGHPNPNNSNGYFDIGDKPSTFTITSYPLLVKLDWRVSEACNGNYVDITRVEAFTIQPD